MTRISERTLTTFEELDRLNKAFSPFSIGLFDNLINKSSNRFIEFQKPIGFPPYNILKKDDVYNIVIAIAGFTKEAIEIEYFDKTLTVKGNSEQEHNDDVEVVYNGIANRAFTRTFTLADNIEVTGADLKNGLLTITCRQWIPERLQKRQILINQTNTDPVTGGDLAGSKTDSIKGDSKQLLCES